MTSAPAVFISSTHGLRREREALLRLASEEFCWPVHASGMSEAVFGGYTKQACLRALELSDLYVGIFGRQAGSILLPFNLAWTELEFYHALNLRKPMLIYVSKAPARDAYARQFRSLLEAEGGEGVYVRHFEDADDLHRRAGDDLKLFADGWYRGEPPWRPSPYLEEEVRSLGVFGHEVGTAVFPGAIDKPPFDPAEVGERLGRMRQHYNRQEFPEAVEVGAGLMAMFLSNGRFRERQEWLRLWADYLLMWAGSCTWLGLVSGHFGALQMARARRQAYRILEYWGPFNESASLLSNCLIVLASIDGSKGARARHEDLRRHFAAQKRKKLRLALTYDDWFDARVPRQYPAFHRSSILRELGAYDEAVEVLMHSRAYLSNQGVVNVTSSELAEINFAAYLGLCLVLGGVEKRLSSPATEGVRLLRRAEADIGRFPDSPYFISVMKRVAHGLLAYGEREEAMRLLSDLRAEALRRGLTHQAMTLDAKLMNG